MEGNGQEETQYFEGTKRKIDHDFEVAKRKAMEVAAKLQRFAEAESKRPRYDSPAAASGGPSSNSTVFQSSYPVFTAPTFVVVDPDAAGPLGPPEETSFTQAMCEGGHQRLEVVGSELWDLIETLPRTQQPRFRLFWQRHFGS